MREVVGFAAGVTLTAGLSLLLRSEGGRRLLRQVVEEGEPELRTAAADWDPLLREVVRAVRLGVREAAEAWRQAESIMATIADEAEATRLPSSEPAAAEPGGLASEA